MKNLKKLIISASMAGAAVVTLGVCGRAAADDSPRPRWDPDTGARRRSPEFVRAGGSGGINRALAAARNGKPADESQALAKNSNSPTHATDTTPTTNSPNNIAASTPPPTVASPATRVAGASEVGGLPEQIRNAALQEVPGASISTTLRREESGTVLYEIDTTGGDQPRELLIREDGVILRNSRVPQ